MAGNGATLPALSLAAGMAFLAGASDVYGLARLHDLFASFMSGNTTMLGVALGRSDWARAALIAQIVGLFVAGAAFGAVIDVVAGRRHASVVLLVVSALLGLPLVFPTWAVPVLVLSMGTLNAAMSRVGSASVSLTYVTGTLVKFGQGLGHAACGRPSGWAWLLQLPMWLSLLAGAVAASLWRAASDPADWWPLPGLALGFALLALLVENASVSTDRSREHRSEKERV